MSGRLAAIAPAWALVGNRGDSLVRTELLLKISDRQHQGHPGIRAGDLIGVRLRCTTKTDR
jgi:hypothetical protein